MSSNHKPSINLVIALENTVHVQLKDKRTISGILYAFDEHSNLLIGDATEIHHEDIFDEDGRLTKTNAHTRALQLMFVRGNSIISVGM